MKFFGISLLLFLQTSISFQTQITVSVFYETKCKDSIKFITEQLVPTWTHFGGAANPVFVIDYVPYGKANEEDNGDGTVTTTCHHGPTECFKNQQHACAIKYLKTELTPFINCSFIEPISSCIEGDKYEKISSCVEKEGKDLLIAYGNRTKILSPPLTYVPWILFDGVFSQTDLDESQVDLKKVLCRKSKVCASKSNSLEPSKVFIALVIAFFAVYNEMK